MREFFAEHHDEFVALGSQFDAGEFDDYETCNLEIPAPPEIQEWAGENSRLMIAPMYEPDGFGRIERNGFSLLTQAGMFYYIPAHSGQPGGLSSVRMCYYDGLCSEGYGSGWFRCSLSNN
jgi:hypothetical protein